MLRNVISGKNVQKPNRVKSKNESKINISEEDAPKMPSCKKDIAVVFTKKYIFLKPMLQGPFRPLSKKGMPSNGRT